MNFYVKNLFSKCERIRIKLRIYSLKFPFNLISSLSYTLHQSTLDTDQYPVSCSEINFWHVRKGQNFQHRNYCTIINILLEHRKFLKLPLFEKVPSNLLVNCLPKKTVFLNREFYLSRTKHIPDRYLQSIIILSRWLLLKNFSHFNMI